MTSPIGRLAALLAAAAFALCLFPRAPRAGAEMDIHKHIPDTQLKKQIARFSQVDVDYDQSVLSAPEEKALAKLVQAGAVMDEIFLRQVWSGNLDLRRQLVHAVSTDGKNKALWNDLYHFFRINFGPWNRLDGNPPFIGNIEKPAGAGFYPDNITKDEFESFCTAHPDQNDAMRGFFTVITRDEHGSLRAVPYSDAYSNLLADASRLLNEAADILTSDKARGELRAGVDYTTLATFLRSRAAAFSSNNYFQSDMDWMDVRDNILDVTIGPYETYEDGLNGYKASFEAFVAIRNPKDSRALSGLKQALPAMERNLPIPDKYKNFHRGTDSPISVVDVAFVGGDSKAGVQTLAFNLPNDERVREAKGSKKVMLKNISQAKYNEILVPIAHRVLDTSQMQYVNFHSYFTNALMHELSHGLGPGRIVVDGRKTTVSRELKTNYAPIEEAKADIMGLYNKAFLAGRGEVDHEEMQKSYICFLPGFFRAIRFGIHEAHGRANMIEYNYIKEHGAISLNEKTGRYTVHVDKMPDAIRALTHDLCMIEALGDYARADSFITKYGQVPDEVTHHLAKLTDIPADIEPVYSAQKFLK